MDIIFVNDNDPRIGNINETNCFNSTDIGFSDVYTITTKAAGSNATTSGASVSFDFGKARNSLQLIDLLGWLPVVAAGFWLIY